MSESTCETRVELSTPSLTKEGVSVAPARATACLQEPFECVVATSVSSAFRGRVARRRGIATPPVCPCCEASRHCSTSCMSVLRGLAALLHLVCVRAARPRGIATPPVCPCRECVAGRCIVTFRSHTSSPLDFSSRRTYLFTHKVELRSVLAAVGGAEVLDKHIKSVPVRELSLLLLPRAPEVCRHLGQTSTGRIGAWPRLPAGGRLALVDES